MSIITTVLLIFLLVCVLILIVPFHIFLKLQKVGGVIEGIFELRWFKLRIFRKKFPEKKAEKEKGKKSKAEKDETKEEKSKWKWEDIKKIIKLAIASLAPLIRFFQDIFHSISVDNFKFHLILGLNSPVDTATVLGYFWAVASLINVKRKVYISAEPSFNQERVDGSIFLELNIRLINPLIAVLRLLTNKSVLKLLWEFRRFRK